MEKKINNVKNNKIVAIILVSFLTFCLGIASSYLIITNYPKLFTENVTKVVKDVTITDTGIAEAVNKVYDSVVVVSTYKNDSLYSSGSGFVYKKDDDVMYIMTNNHVTEDGNNYKITYTDGETAEATLVGSDVYSDIAILKVKNKDNIEAVTLATSSDLNPGDTVFAVGTPLGSTYSWTVTRGIISGKERLVEISLTNSTSSDYILNVIQTDAAVNSGNSGGPLSNANGEVIGIISAKITASGVEGMGFAIPIETAIEKADAIINGETTNYPYLGITMMNVSATNYYGYNRKNNNSNLTSGVVIVDVEKDSSAEKAGLSSEDVITKINDVEVSNIAYLRYELYKYKIGDEVTITYYRNSKEYNTKIKLTTNTNNL
jgi:serine protease Do